MSGIPDLATLTPAQIQAFMNGPALAPPPGVMPNFENPKNLNNVFMVLCTGGGILTGLAVAMRLYTRWQLIRRILLEDLILLAGWIMFVAGMNTTIYQAMQYKLGVHQWNIRVKDFVEYLHYFHYGTLLFCVSMLLLRIAIIMQVLRHFVPKGAKNFTYWTAHVLIWINTCFWLALTLMETFSCTPQAKLWQFWLPGKCLDRHDYLVASSAMNLASEILIMILPQRIIWRLSLTTKQKLELTPLFLVGCLTCICSSIRLWQTLALWPTDDSSYFIAQAVMVWTVPEIACSVLVPCLPSLPQFLRIIRKQSSNGRPASTMFQLPVSQGGTPGKSPRGRGRSWSGRDQPPKVPGANLISDVEYHELVMRTETTVASIEREDTGPWVQTPATVHITGGRGPTKTFRNGTAPYNLHPRDFS